jgi:prepilin-type N-terminal cleavage/methylation domain-containing protein
MKNFIPDRFSHLISRRGFTLVELMVASTIALLLAGGVVELLLQASAEQRRGLGDSTVEEKAYMLQSEIASCLRSMSINQGMSPVYGTLVSDSNGNPLGYTSINVFYPTNGTYNRANITFNPTNGQVIYTPNVLASGSQVLWMTNGSTIVLTNLLFNSSYTTVGSENNSLVNVQFQMNDNGYSNQNPTNNVASVFRNFSVQMRNDY